jgi:hypothetical protein
MLCTIRGLHGSDYEECRLLGYKNLVHTLRETYKFSVTERSRLMLCKIWGFHGGDYEECRLLGFKIPVRISQETHTETSRLMLCTIWGFHGDNYEEYRLLSPSWEADSCSATGAVPNISWNMNVHFPFHNRPILVPILSESNLVCITLSCASEFNLNIIHWPTSWSS